MTACFKFYQKHSFKNEKSRISVRDFNYHRYQFCAITMDKIWKVLWLIVIDSVMIDSEHFTKIQSSLNLFYDIDSILRVKTCICGYLYQEVSNVIGN